MPKRPLSAPPAIAGLTYLRPLGSGGFADVFLYAQDLPRRTVAVKVLVADAIDPRVRDRFATEADLMARLSGHPAILTIYQASIAGDGRPYLVTEYCPGSMALEYRHAPVSVARTLDVGVRIAAALETAHRAGVLHRDIKPSNVLITALAAPVLADFGIATALGFGEAELSSTADRIVAMSVPWSSPEVLDETSRGSVASEVWSLGATLYTLLAGRSPFAIPEGERQDRDRLIRRIQRTQPNPIDRSDVHDDVLRVLRSTMRRDPADRPGSMGELAHELHQLQVLSGLAPTPIDIAAPEAGETLAVPAPGSELRGPTLPTVQNDSRRAARAAAAPAAAPPPNAAKPRRALVLAVGLGAAVAVVVAIGLLVLIPVVTGG